MALGSEIEFRPKLNYARRHATHAAANGPEVLRIQIEINRLWVGIEVVEKVENLRAEFKATGLTDFELFVNRKVGVNDPRQPNRARARRSTESPGWRGHERRGIEPAFPGALIAGQITALSGDQIGARTLARRRSVHIVSNRRGKSALDGRDSGNLPTVQYLSSDASQIPKKWHVVDDCLDKAVRLIEAGNAAFGGQIVDILNPADVEPPADLPANIRRTGDGFRPGVRRQESQSRRHSAFGLDLQRVVVRIADGLVHAHRTRIRRVRAARIERGQAGRFGINQLNGLIGRQRDDQLGPFGADIPDVQHDAAGEFLLNVQIPLLNVTVAHVLVVGDREADRAPDCRAVRIRGEEIRRAGQVAGNRSAARRLRALGHRKVRVVNLRRVIDAVARAHHRVFDEPRLIRETDARAKVVAVSVNQRSAETRSVRKGRVRRNYADDFDVGVLVIRLARTLEIIVPQAEIDRQVRSRLPIVIGIERIPPIPQVRVRVHRIEAAALHIAENEIGKRAPGVSAVEGYAAARVSRLIEGDVAIFDVSAEFEEVSAPLPRERIGKLKDLIGTITWPDLALQIIDAENAIRPTDADARWPVIFRNVRDTGQPHHSGHVEGRIVGGAEDFRFAELVPTAAHFVDQRVAERVRPRRNVVLRAPQVVALVMPPVRIPGFKSVVKDVTPRNRIARRKVVVNARRVVVLLAQSADRRVDEVVDHARTVGQRREFQEGLNLRAERARRNDVIDDADIERIAQHDRRIHAVDLARQVAEIAVAKLGGRHGLDGGGDGADLPPALPVEEEERLVGAVVKPWHAHRPADIRAELIAVQARGLLALFADRVVGLRQRIVAIELP